MLGIAEQERAFTTVHEGAIYLHLGESYRVRALDLETRTALVEPFSGDYYTQAKTETTTAIVEPRRSDRRLGLELSFGAVVVTDQVVGYQKKSIQTPGEPRARPARAAADRVRDRGGLVPPRAVDARGPGADAAAARARCTRPSTR